MIYVFGEYELDIHLYALRRVGKPLKIEPKVFNVLAYLVQHRGSVVSKQELLEHVWPDQYISEATLSGCVMAVRRAVGDSGQAQRVIQTLHGRGYRFVPTLEKRAPEEPDREAQVAAATSDHTAPQTGNYDVGAVLPGPLPALQGQPAPSPYVLLHSPATRPCPACQHVNRATATFCVACGIRLIYPCLGCGQTVHLPATFCPTCGWCLEETSPPLPGAAEFPRGRFIGREQELTTLRSLLTHVKGGRGQAVALVGEPAIGKSWLLNEFRRSLRDGQVTYLEGHCCAAGRTIPYLPLRAIVRQYCGITETDPPEAMAAKVSQRLQESGIAPAEGVASFLHLLGVRAPAGQSAVSSPALRRIRTFASLRQMLLTGSRQRPLVMAIEDLHWIDPTSEDWLASLLESLADAPLLLLVTSRPEYRPAWLVKPSTTQLPLPPLTPHDSLRLVRSVWPQDTLPTPLVQAILARAAGHPLFLEELARAIAEQRAVAADLVMPDTLRGVLIARLEQLPEVPRRLLQTASVLDRTCAVRLLAAAWDGPDGMDPALLELERRALCYEQHGLPEPTYVLKHTLLQEVAYQSLLPAHRQTLHTAVGQVLETLYAGHLEEVYDLLAYHYAHTGEAAKAVEYLTRAAEQATKSWAHVEAAELLQQALGHVARLSAAERHWRRLDLVLRQAHSLVALGRYQDAETLLRQQQACLTQLQDAWLAGRYALLLSQTAQHLGAWESAAQSAHHAVEAATACQDADTAGQALHVLAMERYWAG